jgi:molecular chaperone HscA
MAKIAIDLKSGDVVREEAPLIIGIDLGTTNSLVAWVRDGAPEVVRDAAGKSGLVPSIVYFPDAGEQVIVGEAAREALVTHPERTIFSVKRLMGKSYQDVSGWEGHMVYRIHPDDDPGRLVRVQVGDRFYTPVELSGRILESLKKRVESHLNRKVEKAVITVPAYFNDAQRQATRDAGKLAGLDVLRIINEPTAASLAYGLDHEGERKVIAVYDLGGGTFDISILQLEHGVFEVLSTHGDTFLGGDDIDRLIMDYWRSDLPVGSDDPAGEQSLRLLAEQAKRSLSCDRQFEGAWDSRHLSLSREKLEELTRPLIERTLQSCRSALGDAGLVTTDIQEVILVGGSTRMPLIKEMVSGFFGRRVHDHLNPDEVVAIGAAIQADILAGNRRDLLLLDITPLSLGIETMGGLMDVIIPRNSKVPCAFARNYTTSVDGQKNLKISVFQGERDLVAHNRKLGEFILRDIPPMPAGIPKLEVRFRLNADGILDVQATELRSGVHQQIEVKPQYGISEEEMGRMLLDSLQNAREDMAQKALTEARNEGHMLVAAADRFLRQNQGWLSEEQQKVIGTFRDRLEDLLKEGDKDAIQGAMQALNEYTTPLAHSALERHVAGAMKGTRIL